MRTIKKACAAILAISIAACGGSPSGPAGLGGQGKGDGYSEAECLKVGSEVAQRDLSAMVTAPEQDIIDFVKKIGVHAQCVGAAQAEAKLVDLVAILRNSEAGGAKLDRVLQLLVEGAMLVEALPVDGKAVDTIQKTAKIIDMIQELTRKIDGQLCLHGKLNGCRRIYVPWEQLAARHAGFLSEVPDLRFGDLGFKEDLAYLTNSRFEGGNSLRLMTNGPEALDVRLRLIKKATRSIYLVSWAIYDDPTGDAVTAALVEKANEGVEIKVLVDGQTAMRDHHRNNVGLLERTANVEVVRFRGKPGRQFDGNHRKLFIVDQQVAITGGRNIGDDYFNAEANDGWRDNEMVMTGPAVYQAMELFAKLWTGESQLSVISPELNPTMNTELLDVAKVVPSSAFVAVTDQVPAEVTHSQFVKPGVTMSILKAISGARYRVDIANAYVILTPDIEAALLGALERNVQVNILSNSSSSIDQPEIAGPILGSLQRMLEAGANIYLKQGTTLHSKIMIVDDSYAWMGTYNIHPRSYWYEGEMAVQVLDEQGQQPGSFVQQLRRAFDADMAAAKPAPTVAELDIPAPSVLGVLIDRFFFDAL